jgi:hypothetical protein
VLSLTINLKIGYSTVILFRIYTSKEALLEDTYQAAVIVKYKNNRNTLILCLKIANSYFTLLFYGLFRVFNKVILLTKFINIDK